MQQFLHHKREANMHFKINDNKVKNAAIPVHIIANNLHEKTYGTGPQPPLQSEC